MVDFTNLNTAATGTVNRFHTSVQNIQTANFGKIYSKALGGLDYYIIECVAKPALQKAPEWFTSNRAVDAIRTHQGLSMVAGAALAVASFVSLMIWLHPEGTTPISGDTPPLEDDDTVAGGEGVGGDGDKSKAADDAAKANGADDDVDDKATSDLAAKDKASDGIDGEETKATGTDAPPRHARRSRHRHLTDDAGSTPGAKAADKSRSAARDAGIDDDGDEVDETEDGPATDKARSGKEGEVKAAANAKTDHRRVVLTPLSDVDDDDDDVAEALREDDDFYEVVDS